MIFCFQEDENLLKILLASLSGAGFQAEGFRKAHELFNALSTKRPSLVIADITCERDDGSAILTELRESAVSRGFSILIIATKFMTENRLCGIDFKDETCLFKPFNVTQFMQAVNTALRPDLESGKKMLSFANLRFEVDSNKVEVDGEEVKLTAKEYMILYILMDNTEQVFTREQLFGCVWQSDYLGESRTVDVHIQTLRRKLGTAGRYIKTVHGKGYCMQEIE